MKYSSVFFLCCLLSATLLLTSPLASASCNESHHNDDGSIIPVLLNPIPQVPSGAPRSLNTNPFWAYYSMEDGEVVVGCTDANYGKVSIHLYSTAGDNITCSFDAGDESISIPVSGYSGVYVITITTPVGLFFGGEFVLF